MTAGSDPPTGLRKIDYFTQPVVDETTRTSLGGVMTILIPFAVAAYIAVAAVIFVKTPPIETTENQIYVGRQTGRERFCLF
jgi:hypothetical protein